jgi:hypothetical protein
MHRHVLSSNIDGDWVLSAVVVVTVGGWFFVLQYTFSLCTFQLGGDGFVHSTTVVQQHGS